MQGLLPLRQYRGLHEQQQPWTDSHCSRHTSLPAGWKRRRRRKEGHAADSRGRLQVRALLWRRRKADSDTAQYHLLEPIPQAREPSKRWQGWAVFGALVAVGALFAYRQYQAYRNRPIRRSWAEGPSRLQVQDEDPGYQMALARTRQAMAVHRATEHMMEASPARAMVEIERALQENALCREPIKRRPSDKDEVEGLYRLHLQNTEVPPRYSTLLQLRSLLALDAAEAAQIEAEVMGTVSFNI